jgi:hypothetical protein
MVKDHIWEEFGVGKGMLCVECFEKRLGRKLEPYDLSYCHLKYPGKSLYHVDFCKISIRIKVEN